jgi:hypothetical protein
MEVNKIKPVIILTYLQDCLQQEQQLDLNEFLLVFHEVAGTGLDLLSAIQSTYCTISASYRMSAQIPGLVAMVPSIFFVPIICIFAHETFSNLHHVYRI